MLPCLWRVAAELVVRGWHGAIPACTIDDLCCGACTCFTGGCLLGGLFNTARLLRLLGFGALEMFFVQDNAQLQVSVRMH